MVPQFAGDAVCIVWPARTDSEKESVMKGEQDGFFSPTLTEACRRATACSLAVHKELHEYHPNIPGEGECQGQGEGSA